MKSILAINKPPRNRRTDWNHRIEAIRAVDDAEAKELARHHFLLAQVDCIGDLKRGITDQSKFAKMSKAELKMVGKWQAHNAVNRVFGSCRVMQRFQPGLLAITKLAGGVLPSDLREIEQKIWRTLGQMEEVRRRYYSYNSPAARLTIDLSSEMRPLCDELYNQIVAIYALAQSRYDLPDIEIGGAQ